MVHTSRLIGWLAALLIIAGGGYFLYYYFFSANLNLPQKLIALSQIKKSGEEQAALDKAAQIQNDPSMSSSEKASAQLFTVGLAYNVTADESSIVQEIQNMKRIVLDTSLPDTVRAAAMSVLGNEYTYSGRNPVIFDQIFADAPFSQYKVSNEPLLSSLNLEKASYEIQASSFAAIKVASFATLYNAENPNQTASSSAKYTALALQYLNHADMAAIDEAKRNGDSAYNNSDRQILYKLSRAIVVGRLAVQQGDPFVNLYASGFENYIKAAQTGNSALSTDVLTQARFHYAMTLGQLKETAKEKEQLDLLAKDLGSISNPQGNSLVLALKNSKKFNPNGSTWRAAQQMMTVSPEFSATVNKLLASNK